MLGHLMEHFQPDARGLPPAWVEEIRAWIWERHERLVVDDALQDIMAVCSRIDSLDIKDVVEQILFDLPKEDIHAAIRDALKSGDRFQNLLAKAKSEAFECAQLLATA